MYFKKQTLGWYALITLSISPIFLWMVIQPLGDRFSSTALIFTSLGEIAGLTGMALFSLDLVLGARVKWFEQYFGGLNRVYLAHHLFGGIAFILLMLHPLFLAGVYLLDSVKSAALFLLPGPDWAINLGIAAFYLMMALLVITFFVKLPYNIWKFSHKFLGLAFFIGAIHSLFVPSDISRNPVMRDYMLIFVVVGLVFYVYRTLMGKFFVRRSVYAVDKVRRLAQDVVEIDLKSIARPLRFNAGQFIFVGFEDSNIPKEMHPFSISSAPNEDDLSVIVKASGDYTKKLLHVHTGSKAFVEGAFGAFRYDTCKNNQQIWIGGGIGITPFIAMAKTLGEHPSIQVDLYYTMHDETESVYVEDLKALANAHKNLAVAPLFSSQRGRLTADIIAEASGDITRKDIFLCGPPPMMYSLKKQFIKLGVPKDQIHSEEFQWE